METFEIRNEVPATNGTPKINESVTAEPMSLEELKAIREEVGRSIDPETAEVTFSYCLTLDPYGELGDIAEEFRQVGREYFARPPGGDTWVWFGDLPKPTRDALWERLRNPESARNKVVTDGNDKSTVELLEWYKANRDDMVAGLKRALLTVMKSAFDEVSRLDPDLADDIAESMACGDIASAVLLRVGEWKDAKDEQ